MFDPDGGMPRLNRSLVYPGACLIAGIRLARVRQVNVRVVRCLRGGDQSKVRVGDNPLGTLKDKSTPGLNESVRLSSPT